MLSDAVRVAPSTGEPLIATVGSIPVAAPEVLEALLGEPARAVDPMVVIVVAPDTPGLVELLPRIGCHDVPGLPTTGAAMTVVPFISQIATAPLVCVRLRRREIEGGGNTVFADLQHIAGAESGIAGGIKEDAEQVDGVAGGKSGDRAARHCKAADLQIAGAAGERDPTADNGATLQCQD